MLASPTTSVFGTMLRFARAVATVLADAAAGLPLLRRKMVSAVFHKQVFFTGIQALPPVSVAAVALGMTLESQMRMMLGSGIELNVKMLKVVVLREMAPLVTAIIVLGRSGAAMATELASMKVQGEVRGLYLAGIDPGGYLVMPRVAACAVAVPVLTIYFQVLSAVLGPALAAIFMEIDLGSYYDAILNSLRLPEMLVSMAKTTTFGLLIAAVACTCGLHVPLLRTWVPQAAEMAVMRGLTLLLIADVLFGLLML